MSRPLLSVEGLHCRYRLDRSRTVEVLANVGFELHPGEVLAVVGESGSGKSTLALAIPQLLPANAEVWKGKVWFQDEDLTSMSNKQLRSLRGPGIAMVFQDPFASLNPTFSIGAQMVEIQRAHSKTGNKRLYWRRAVEMLEAVGIPDASNRINDFPHQFSGGMLQRVMIAMAAMLRPKILIADEPTSSLDVTLEVQVLDLLNRLRAEFGTAIIFITHDLLVASEIGSRLVVMYAGRVVEHATVGDIFEQRRHPYTEAMMLALPTGETRGARLESVPGAPPPLSDLPEGCKFAPRCQYRHPVCTVSEPELVPIGSGSVRCWRYDAQSGHPDAARVSQTV